VNQNLERFSNTKKDPVWASKNEFQSDAESARKFRVYIPRLGAPQNRLTFFLGQPSAQCRRVSATFRQTLAGLHAVGAGQEFCPSEGV